MSNCRGLGLFIQSVLGLGIMLALAAPDAASQSGPQIADPLCSGKSGHIDWKGMNRVTDDCDDDGTTDCYREFYDCGNTNAKADALERLFKKAFNKIGKKASPCVRFQCVQPLTGSSKCVGYQIESGYQGFKITHDGTPPGCSYSLQDKGPPGGSLQVTCGCVNC